MGYTHYLELKKPLQQKQFDAIRADVEVIIKMTDGIVCETAGKCYPEETVLLRGWDGNDDPTVSHNEIRFNGDVSKGLDHETMSLEVGGDGFSFCKTARKPYDVAVCLTLLSVAHHLGDDVEVSSDGNKDDWMPAYRLYKDIFNRLPPRVVK